MPRDWYRKVSWTDDDERDFRARLKRARPENRGQYVYLQAITLLGGADRWLTAAELLLREHIDTYPDDFRRGEAFNALGELFERREEVGQALEQYQLAMARMREHPGRPYAWLSYARLVARRRLRAHYETAKSAIAEFDAANPFPLHIFRVNAALALIAKDEQRNEDARTFAIKALAAASAKTTGLRYHPLLGLVGSEEGPTIRELSRIAGSGGLAVGWPFRRRRGVSET